MALSQDDLEHIRQLLKLVEDNGLTELKTSQPDGLTVAIGTGPAAVTALVPIAPQQLPALAIPTADEAPPSPVAKGVALESPMVGVFYRAQSPNDPPFAREGEIIEVGQTIGLIEAMKVFSEIPAEIGGRIISFVVKNSQLVQLGQPLAYIEPV